MGRDRVGLSRSRSQSQGGITGPIINHQALHLSHLTSEIVAEILLRLVFEHCTVFRAQQKLASSYDSDSANTVGVFENIDHYSQKDLNLFFKKFAPNVPQGTHPIPAPVDGAHIPSNPKYPGGRVRPRHRSLCFRSPTLRLSRKYCGHDPHFEHSLFLMVLQTLSGLALF